ncbi:MAG: synthase subunit delta [Gammaproteobacteria bacterium]|jgi:F-type H+-transporting ATPase subunit delta|nr:synthase subunit delta [Gammaproteobacteria bacterium]
MATASTIARPYAKAAFEYAKEQHAEKAWSTALDNLARLFENKEIQGLLHHPKLTQKELAEVLLEKSLNSLDASIQNFVKILAENSRLSLLPEISLAYEEHVAESQKVCQAILISAEQVDSNYIEQIKKALSKKLNQSVELETEIDESLIGGAIIKAGDLVIDGSVKGQLNRLAQELRK